MVLFFLRGTFCFVNGTVSFVNGTVRFVNGTDRFVNGTDRFVKGTVWFVNGTFHFVNGTVRFLHGTVRYRGVIACFGSVKLLFIFVLSMMLFAIICGKIESIIVLFQTRSSQSSQHHVPPMCTRCQLTDWPLWPGLNPFHKVPPYRRVPTNQVHRNSKCIVS